jgi:hypothetical protein
VYCLTQRITSGLPSGAAISINSNNVVLDLNDFAIGNLGAGATTTAIGIYAVDRQNIRIRNGILRGFWAGVGLVNGTTVGLTTATSSGHIVEGVITDTSYFAGIAVEGAYVTVKNSKVMNTIGSNVANPSIPGAQNHASGISAGGGTGIHIVSNEVFNTDCTNGCSLSATVRGIEIAPSIGPVIENNILINQTVRVGSPDEPSRAIHFGSQSSTAATANAFVVRNFMSNWNRGISFCAGSVVCTGDMVANGAQGVANAYSNGGTNVPSGASNF